MTMADDLKAFDNQLPSGSLMPSIFRQVTPADQQFFSFQPGGKAMAGPWGDPSAGGAPGQTGQIDPQMLKRLQLYQLLMSQRGGTAGMQPGSAAMQSMGQMRGAQGQPVGYQNALSGIGQQGGGMMAAILQNPQLLQWIMQQQGGGQGAYPQGGGGVDLLARILGSAPQQTQPT